MTNGQSDNSPNGEVLKSVAHLTVDDDLYFGIQIASSARGPYVDAFLATDAEIVQEHKPIRGIGFFEGEDGLLIEHAGVKYRVTMACAE
jgi:hemin uptake protein HemP